MPAKTRAVRKVHKQGKGKIGPCARAQSVVYCGETKSSSGVAKVSILRLRLSWGLDAHGCRLLLLYGVVPWWRWGSYTITLKFVPLSFLMSNEFVKHAFVNSVYSLIHIAPDAQPCSMHWLL